MCKTTANRIHHCVTYCKDHRNRCLTDFHPVVAIKTPQICRGTSQRTFSKAAANHHFQHISSRPDGSQHCKAIRPAEGTNLFFATRRRGPRIITLGLGRRTVLSLSGAPCLHQLKICGHRHRTNTQIGSPA